jgi:cytochrome c oxidase assembly protein subunit 15
VSALVIALAAYAWWVRRGPGTGEQQPPSSAPYVALGLLVVQVLLGAVTVKLRLPPWTVILHLGTAMLLLATLLVIAKRPRLIPGWRPGLVALGLGFVTVLLGALTANLGAASACLGFPLCNGQLVPGGGNYLQYVHWTHRVFAYVLLGYVVWWAPHTKRRGAWYVVALVAVQVTIAGAMVLFALPEALQAAHVAVGTAVWAGLVLVECSVVSVRSSVLTTDN